jgi:hypothetical protein
MNYIVIDRLVIDPADMDLSARVSDSAQTAFSKGKELVLLSTK